MYVRVHRHRWEASLADFGGSHRADPRADGHRREPLLAEAFAQGDMASRDLSAMDVASLLK